MTSKRPSFLQAVDSAPVSLSETGIERLLRVGLPLGTPLERYEDAILIAFVLAVRARENPFGEDGPGLATKQFVVAPDKLSADSGLPKARVSSAASALGVAGVLVAGERGRVRFAAEALETASAAVLLDWSWILDCLTGDLSALRVSRGLAQRMGAGVGEWFSQPMSELAKSVGLKETALRRARRTLCEKGIIEERETRGEPLRVRFTARATGMQWADEQTSPLESTAPVERAEVSIWSTPNSAAGPVASLPSAARRAEIAIPEGMKVRMGTGVPGRAPPGMVVELGPGVRLRVERDGNGEEVVWAGPLGIGPAQ